MVAGNSKKFFNNYFAVWKTQNQNRNVCKNSEYGVKCFSTACKQ